MFLPEPRSIETAIRQFFDPHTISKGRSYFEEGFVQSCVATFDDVLEFWKLEAKVQGSEPWAYKVVIELDVDETEMYLASSECSCPLAGDCKHAAATLLYAATYASRLFGMPGMTLSELPPSLQKARKKEADAAWNIWLTNVEGQFITSKSSPKAATPPQAQPRESLLYILREGYNGLQVDLQLVRPLKSGKFGATMRPCPLLTAARSELLDGVLPEDRRLARKLVLELGTFESASIPLNSAQSGELLKEIISTGRCYWQTHQSEALTLGESRKATPVWRKDHQGGQIPGFDVEPPISAVLPLSPLWYLDKERNQCGRLETTLPDAIAAFWLKAPRVPAGAAEKVSAAIAARHPDLKLPAPAEIKIEDMPNERVVPCLRLYSVRLKPEFSWAYPRKHDKEFNFASLEFDYGGVRATDGDPPVICLAEKHHVKRLVRNQAAEDAAFKILFDCGFAPAEEAISGYELGNAAASLALDDSIRWFDFACTTLPQLEKQGWRVEREESFRFQIAEPEDWYSDAESHGDNQWFEVELGVVLDGQKINLLPVILQCLEENPHLLSKEALERDQTNVALPVTLPDGRMVGFPMQRLRKSLGVLLELLDPSSLNRKGRLKISRLRAAELAGDAEWRWLGSAELKEFAKKLRNFEGIRPVAPPEALQAHLRPYQKEGLNWLQFLREYQLSGILADDMGLGKTVQALAHLLIEKESGRMDRPSLVVAPTSLMTNWRQEAQRFAPGLKVLVLHGLDRKQHFEQIREHDLVITSYPLLPRDQAVLLKEEFHYLILDEAQYIKNAKTTYAQVACTLRARHHLCLTGTPMENHLGELWSLFNFLLPGFLGDETRFNAIFRRPIEKFNQDERRKVLARRVAPFILRRRKEQVVKELPPKTEIVQKVELTSAQRDLYESVRLAMHAKVKAEVARKGMSRSHIVILDALLKLRQICCHPQLLSLPTAKKVKESAKMELLMDLMPEMIAEGRRILLFSQFTSMLALVEKELDAKKIPYVLLTGETRDRATPIEQFQKGEVPLFLISLKAGGTGLNLTAADTVIHYDPWWNPAVENQATDRAHRIGQTKNVFVYKLLTEGTVEEKILALQARKKELVEGLLNEERKENLKLSQEDIDLLFAPLDGK